MPFSSSQFLFGKTRNWVSQNNIQEHTLFILSILGKDLHIIWLQIQKSNSALRKRNNSTQVVLLGIFQVSGLYSLFPTRYHIVLFKVNKFFKGRSHQQKGNMEIDFVGRIFWWTAFLEEELGLCLWAAPCPRSDTWKISHRKALAIPGCL